MIGYPSIAASASALPSASHVPRRAATESWETIDSVRNIGKGLGGANPEYGYAWYAGI